MSQLGFLPITLETRRQLTRLLVSILVRPRCNWRIASVLFATCVLGPSLSSEHTGAVSKCAQGRSFVETSESAAFDLKALAGRSDGLLRLRELDFKSSSDSALGPRYTELTYALASTSQWPEITNFWYGFNQYGRFPRNISRFLDSEFVGHWAVSPTVVAPTVGLGTIPAIEFRDVLKSAKYESLTVVSIPLAGGAEMRIFGLGARPCESIELERRHADFIGSAATAFDLIMPTFTIDSADDVGISGPGQPMAGLRTRFAMPTFGDKFSRPVADRTRLTVIGRAGMGFTVYGVDGERILSGAYFQSY